MVKIQQEGNCPFCLDESGQITSPNKIAARTEEWIAIERWPGPYENAVLHWLLIPVRRLEEGGHLTSLEELLSDDLPQIQFLVGEAAKLFLGVPFDYGLAYRQGPGAGRTMAHFHIHLIVPKLDPETGQIIPGKHVNFPIG